MSAPAQSLQHPSLIAATAFIFARELRAELRTRELLNTTAVFVLMAVVMFSFSLNPTAEESRRFGPGLLWLAFLFAGSLMLQPAFVREMANETLDALRLAPVNPAAILFGKAAANFVFLTAAEWLMLPVFAALFNVPLLSVWGRLTLVLALGTLGFCVTGAMFSAMTAQARMRELLLPLLLLPVQTPVLVVGVGATAALMTEPPELLVTPVKILVGFDVIFLATAWLLFEYLVEE